MNINELTQRINALNGELQRLLLEANYGGGDKEGIMEKIARVDEELRRLRKLRCNLFTLIILSI